MTVEEEDEFDPADRWGEPVKKIIRVKFGDHQVARYELESNFPGHFYYDSADGKRRILYDEPEEFLAEKLKKLFALIEVGDVQD